MARLTPYAATILLIAAHLASSALAADPRGLALADADLDGDGLPDALTFYAASDGTRAFLHVTSRAGPLAKVPQTSPLYPAWKAAPGRLDADGPDRIVLGTWVKSRQDPRAPPRRSIWVVGLDLRGQWVELWRGSRLQRPFSDFAVVDLDGDGPAELVVRECPGDGRGGFTAYRWSGFGFVGVGRLASPCRDNEVEPWYRLELHGETLRWRNIP